MSFSLIDAGLQLGVAPWGGIVVAGVGEQGYTVLEDSICPQFQGASQRREHEPGADQGRDGVAPQELPEGANSVGS